MILQKLKEWVKKMFPAKTIKQAYNVDVAVSETMIHHIDQWNRMYSGKAPWVDNDSVISLGLEQAIVREFANITLNEMTAKVNNENLDTIFQTVTHNLNINLQKALAVGGMVIKPLGEDKLQYISQSSFIPIEYDVTGRLIKVIFPEIKKVSEFEYLTRLEYHDLDYDKGLTIINKAFKSSSADTLGKEIPLASVQEWMDLLEEVSYPLMKRPAFGYYVNPIDNSIDESKTGVSIFESAKRLIKCADIQFSRLEWEFASGERAIHVDEKALRGDGTIDKLNRRLYRGLDLDNGNGELFKEYSPGLRQADFIAGLEEYKRSIEFSVGLSYGDISNPQTVEKTATEIKSAKKRKYNTVSAIQNNLNDCLSDLVYALAFYNGLATSNYEFICDFRDSILVDEETERQQDKEDMSIGVMGRAEYRSKWYGETIEDAIKNLPPVVEVME